MFWSSDELTGNQTEEKAEAVELPFWSSDELTGNQTARAKKTPGMRFGAVTN